MQLAQAPPPPLGFYIEILANDNGQVAGAQLVHCARPAPATFAPWPRRALADQLRWPTQLRRPKVGRPAFLAPARGARGEEAEGIKIQ